MALPKSASRVRSACVPKHSRITKENASTIVDIRDSDRSRSPISNLPHALSSSDHPVSRWMVRSDQFASQDTTFPLTQFGQPHSGTSLLNSERPPTSGVSWDHAAAMGNLMLSPGQPLPHEQYQYSDSSGSLDCGSELVIDPLAIDPSIDVPYPPRPGFHELPLGATDMIFKSDLVSGSLSYDGSNTSDMSPPLSPELDDQAWPAQPVDYSTNGEHTTYGITSGPYLHLPVRSQKQPWPPSPPISDGEAHARLDPTGQPVDESRFSVVNTTLQGRTNRDSGGQGRYRDAVSNTSYDPTGSLGANGLRSSQSSRPVPRMLKSASEKPRGHDQPLHPTSLSGSGQTKPKEKPESSQPRNHHLYKVSPGRDGLFRCPFAQETQCAHVPTKQKCGYDKYLDSHLKPYQCKHQGCQELKFSSNACLFRHEREAHGMHFYGKNPHRCLFVGCDRAFEGFPRRWNLHDHMRRVHKYDAPPAMNSKDQNSDGEVPSKRKGSTAPTSCQMKRASSSLAKARAASTSYSRERPETFNPRYQVTEQLTGSLEYDNQPFEVGARQTLGASNRSICGIQHLSYVDADPRISYGFSYL